MAFATFDSGKLTNATLDGTSLIATATGVGQAIAQGTNSTGKWYFELITTVIVSGNGSVGIGNFSAGALGTATPSANTIQVFKSGNIWNNAVNTGLNIGALTTNSVVCVAVDLSTSLAWFRLGAAGNWNGSAANNPATGVGGVSIAAWGRGLGSNFYPSTGLGASGDKTTANFGASAFTGAVPAGFTSGWTTATAVTLAGATTVGAEVWADGTPAIRATMLGAEIWSPAPTGITFDPTNLSAVTLSNFNLTATQTSTLAWVYGTSGQAAGKYYFEYTLVTAPSNADQIGVATVAVPGVGGSTVGVNLSISSPITVVTVTVSGTTVINAPGFGAVTIGAGTVIGVAVDFDNQTIWFRVGAAAQWNGNVNGNPTTNTGGASFAAIGARGVSFTPRLYFNNAGSRIVSLNSGDSGAFAGAVPAGFTSGFPKGGPGNTNALFTQVGAEAWRVGASDARFTQVGAEVWRSVATSVIVTGRARRVVTIST